VSPIVSGGNGVPFLVSAGIVYEIIAAACSSPQTAEINADRRATTLMKWVNIGLVQATLFVSIAVWVDREHWQPIVAGGGLAAALMLWSYRHAMAAGLASSAAGTESY
jgi:hypothetical protein